MQRMALRAVKVAIVSMIGVDQKFDLVFEDYADYEPELLVLSCARCSVAISIGRCFKMTSLACLSD